MAWYDDVFKFVKDHLDPGKGYDTAAQGAQQGSAMSGADAALQYQRQMQGLNASLQQINGYKSLYDQLYGTHTAQTPQQLQQISGGNALSGLAAQSAGAGQPPQSFGIQPRPSQAPAWMRSPQGGPPQGGSAAPAPSLSALFAQSK